MRRPLIISFGFVATLIVTYFIWKGNFKSSPVQIAEIGSPSSISGYDIIIIAGQSNTSAGLAVDPAIDVTAPNIFQLGRFGTDDLKIIPATEPLHFHNNAGSKGIGFGLALARRLRSAGFATDDRPLLIIPAGKGGTGLNGTPTDCWMPGDMCHEDLITRTNQIMNMVGKSNRIIGFFWMQGESDTSLRRSQADYEKDWLAMMANYQSKIKGFYPATPVFIGQMVPSWIRLMMSQVPATGNNINAAHQNLPKLRPKTFFVSAERPFEIGNNDEAGTPYANQDVHYSAASQRVLAERFFNSFMANSGISPASGNNISPYKVGAYYFGFFSSELFSKYGYGGWNTGTATLPGSQKMYGRINDPWAGVRDLYENKAPLIDIAGKEWWADDWAKYRSHLKPVIGYYDEKDPTVLEKHIMQAKQNGLSFFNFYWYWSTQSKKEMYNTGLESFLKARNNNDMEFMIGIHQHGYALTMSKEDIPLVVAKIAEYTKRQNYLRTKSGRPIIQLGDTRGIHIVDPANPNYAPQKDSATVNSFLSQLRQAVKNTTGQDPLISYRIESGKTSWDDGSMKPAVDAFSYLIVNQDPRFDTGPYFQQFKNLPQYNKPMMPCSYTWFDERPRLGLLKPKSTISTNYQTYLIQGRTLFDTNLTNTKKWIDSQADELSHIVTIYAWNEWHEGGIIEPDVKNKALYLNLIASKFSLSTGTDPCRTTGDCRLDTSSAVSGDLTGDGKVDIFDFNKLVANFGNPYTIFDYNALVANYGK